MQQGHERQSISRSSTSLSEDTQNPNVLAREIWLQTAAVEFVALMELSHDV